MDTPNPSTAPSCDDIASTISLILTRGRLKSGIRVVSSSGGETIKIFMTGKCHRETRKRFESGGVIRRGEGVILGFRRILAKQLGVPDRGEGTPL